MNLVTQDRLIPYLRKNTVIWRSCGHHAEHGAKINDIEFYKTETGSYMARTLLCGSGEWIYEPIVYTDNNPTGNRGVITFLRELPPPNWTYLIVNGIGKNSKVIFAEYGGTLPESDYLRFRDLYRYTIQDTFNVNIKEKLFQARGIYIELAEEEDVRAFINYSQRLKKYGIECPLEVHYGRTAAHMI